jgi:hypothetical protein
MTEVMITRPLTETARTRLREFADVLIPGGAGLPSASDADGDGSWTDRTLAANSDLLALVWRVLDTPGEPEQQLRLLREREPAIFEGFAFAVSGAYFMNPEVRRAFGYPGNAPRRMPAAEGEAEYYLEDDVLAPVILRGPVYRAVND